MGRAHVKNFSVPARVKFSRLSRQKRAVACRFVHDVSSGPSISSPATACSSLRNSRFMYALNLARQTNKLRNPFTNHHGREIGVCAHYTRHHRRVRDAQPFHAKDSALRIDDGQRIVRCSDGTSRTRMKHRARRANDVVVRKRIGCYPVDNNSPRHNRGAYHGAANQLRREKDGARTY